ncbi:MAG: ATP-binding protein [Isosphaeraceae bacterium]
MASNKQLTALFRAIAAENFGGATEIAAQICKQEEEKGHHTAARMLRGALNASRNGGVSHKARHPVSNGAGVISTALTRLPDGVGLSFVTLPDDAREELAGLKLEWEHRSRLTERGIGRRTKLLFHGPPGCGKSLTASALAMELGLPLYLVRFDAVIGAYLGQTAVHLRQLFHFAETTPCVLLFDELDALGRRRGNPTDVGELDRIVIALMQELEHTTPQGLIIGTSNLAKGLDDALWRRFDFILEFRAPAQKALVNFARQLASELSVQLSDESLAKVAKSKNFANAEAIVVAEARRQVLRDS